MKFLLAVLFILSASFYVRAQNIPSLNFAQLDAKIRNEDRGQVKVINFWATWCKPCIEELPYFERLHKDFADKNVKVLLVSLDMEAKRAVMYKQKKHIQSEVVYLDDVDQNAWINKVSSDWTGSIPATLIILPDGTEKFYEKKFSSQDELYQTVNSLLHAN